MIETNSHVKFIWMTKSMSPTIFVFLLRRNFQLTMRVLHVWVSHQST